MIHFEAYDSGDVIKRLSTPGRYLVTRQIAVLGRKFSRSIRCNSPASAVAKLDLWEKKQRASMIATAEKRLLRLADEGSTT